MRALILMMLAVLISGCANGAGRSGRGPAVLYRIEAAAEPQQIVRVQDGIIEIIQENPAAVGGR